MTIDYRILDFARIDLSKEYLQGLPEPYLDFVVSSGLIVNDLSVFVKLLLGFTNRDIKVTEEIQILVIHQLSIFRVFGSKIFEAGVYYSAFLKKVRRAKLQDGEDLARELEARMSQIRASPEYQIAEKIRNDATHHYQLKDIRQSLNKMPPHHPLTILFGENHGNSFYFLSDEVGYLTLFAEEGQPGITVAGMLIWYAQTAGSIIDIQQIVIKHIFERHKPRLGRRKKLFVESKYLATSEMKLPTLMVRPKQR